MRARYLLRLLPLLLSVPVLLGGRVSLADDVRYQRDILPILTDTCYACHGPDQAQRQGGDPDRGGLRFDLREAALADLGGYAAIVPGKPADSELVRRINSADADEVMPPPDHPKQLTAEQKELLSRWIAQGAAFEQHWAWVAPQRQAPPETRNRDWPRGWIDAFILARLEREGLQPAPVADPRTLLRRLSFDLTGLPPNAADVERFLAGASDQAYEAAVDRLLESPHYGERMAMYWLDLVRYADTVGYHGDQDVSVSPYRDYVIQAFNANLPFDRFTREQLAGDLLSEPTRDQLIASGYNKLGMMSAEGGVQPKEYLAKYASDRVRTASGVWLGMTLGCCECHDHKFDPVTTRDFYRFAAFFADIKERGLYSGAHASGDWGPRIEVPDAELPALLAPLDEQLAVLERTLTTATPELDAAQREWEIRQAAVPTWQVLRPSRAAALHGTQLAVQEDGSLLAGGASPDQNEYTVQARLPAGQITAFRLEVLPHKSLPKSGPGRAGNGNFVISEFVVRTGDDPDGMPVKLRHATATIEQQASADSHPDKKWSAASTIDDDARGASWGWAVLPEVGQRHELVVEATDAVPGDREVTFVIRQQHTNPKHTLGHFRLAATTRPGPLQASRQHVPDPIQRILQVAAAERTTAQAEELAAYYRSIAPELAATRQQQDALRRQRAELVKQHTRSTLITVAVTPREMRVLPRGNWMDMSGEVVEPGVPELFGQLEIDGRPTRLHLAEWLTSRDNPLTARVFVNRLWKLFFGTGLSKVLDDVGAQGEYPVHPELLDALAVEFMESGWDVKHLVKLIVMSNAYRQSSLMRSELRERDPYNRFLARQSRYRLDAEMIRDNALAVSGLLVRKVGGRSAKPYQPAGLYRHLNFPRRTYQHDVGANQYRRGVYTHWQRQFLHPAMKAFDAPSREECTASRPRSNTPLGALVLLNDPSYVEAARAFAAASLRQAEDGDARIQWMLREALGRKAEPDELRVLGELVQSQQQYFQQQQGAAGRLVAVGLSTPDADLEAAELAAWTAVARVVFNLHEFVTRN